MQLGLIRDTLNKEILLYKESIKKKNDVIGDKKHPPRK